MKDWKEKILELTPEVFLEFAGIKKEQYFDSVEDTYIEDDAIYSSIGTFIVNGIETYMAQFKNIDKVYIGAYTNYRGDGDYRTFIEIPDNNGPNIYIEMYTKNDTYIEFAKNLINSFKEILEKPVIDSIRINYDCVLDLNRIIGKTLSEKEVIRMQDYFDGYQLENIIRLVYENIKE